MGEEQDCGCDKEACERVRVDVVCIGGVIVAGMED